MAEEEVGERESQGRFLRNKRRGRCLTCRLGKYPSKPLMRDSLTEMVKAKLLGEVRVELEGQRVWDINHM